MFHELVVDRGDISLECFNRAIQKYGMWQEENILLSMSSLTDMARIKHTLVDVESYKKSYSKDEECMCRDYINGGLSLSNV